MPLSVHLCLASQRKAVKPLVVAQVSEDRLHGGHAPTIQSAATWCIDCLSHGLHVGEW